jgi:hypothetical protein
MALQWEPRMQDLESDRLCDQCLQTYKARVECRNCPATICWTCFGEKDRQIKWQEKHFREHRDDRDFVVVFPKFWQILKEYEASCECASDPLSIAHCDRCFKRKSIQRSLILMIFAAELRYAAVRVGDTIYVCRNCRIEYGVARALCEECCIGELDSHPPSHRRETIMHTWNSNLPDDAAKQGAQAFQCAVQGCGESGWHQALLSRQRMLMRTIFDSHALRNHEMASASRAQNGRWTRDGRGYSFKSSTTMPSTSTRVPAKSQSIRGKVRIMFEM